MEESNYVKFGKMIYFEDGGGSESSSKSMTVVGKKGKGATAVGGGQLKVCGMHSKSPRVIVAGIEQRFFQQCNKFSFLSSWAVESEKLAKLSSIPTSDEENVKLLKDRANDVAVTGKALSIIPFFWCLQIKPSDFLVEA